MSYINAQAKWKLPKVPVLGSTKVQPGWGLDALCEVRQHELLDASVVVASKKDLDGEVVRKEHEEALVVHDQVVLVTQPTHIQHACQDPSVP